MEVGCSKRQPGTWALECCVMETCNMEHGNQRNLNSLDSPDSPEQSETVGLFRRPTGQSINLLLCNY